jgi:hypothetical protein
MKMPANHFDFSAILPLISNLEELIICYKVADHENTSYELASGRERARKAICWLYHPDWLILASKLVWSVPG